jgi:hypothetical protein
MINSNIIIITIIIIIIIIIIITIRVIITSNNNIIINITCIIYTVTLHHASTLNSAYWPSLPD